MGYAGGDYENPTYRDLGDQTEAFEVDFDPTVISYEDLVRLALASHDPTRPAHKTQYASLILAHDDAQLAIARRVAEEIAASRGRALATRIEPLKRFWPAEDYHQKYYLRNDSMLMADFRAMLPSDTDFVASPSAARANGYVAGDGTPQGLQRDEGLLGLSEAGRKHLSQRVARGFSAGGCSL